MKMTSKFLASLVCFGVVTFSTPTFADPEVITLEEGEKAPWSGTLLNPEAAAKILATGESDLLKCQIEAERNLAIKEAELQLQVSTKTAELVACQLRQTEQQRIYTQQIEYLEKRSAEPTWVKPTLFAGGVVTGIAVVVLSAYTLEKIQ